MNCHTGGRAAYALTMFPRAAIATATTNAVTEILSGNGAACALRMEVRRMPKLKPCTFCGEKPHTIDVSKLINGRWGLTHFCYIYGEIRPEIVTSVYAPTKKELFERWNRRASDET